MIARARAAGVAHSDVLYRVYEGGMYPCCIMYVVLVPSSCVLVLVFAPAYTRSSTISCLVCDPGQDFGDTPTSESTTTCALPVHGDFVAFSLFILSYDTCVWHTWYEVLGK